MIFERLFRRKEMPSKADGLTQPEREAILDLLLLGHYSDNHLSLAEEKVIQDESSRFDWHSTMAVEFYIAEATTRARNARGNDEMEQAILENVAQRLARPESRNLAHDLLKRLFRADAHQPEPHERFLARVSKYLSFE